MTVKSKPWDLFISHASEDKTDFVRPLAVALQHLGLRVWYDEFSLRLGDSLSRSIDRGLADSRFGLAVISQHFLTKPWPVYELRGLVAREIDEDRVILPLWHGVTRQQVLSFSPPLADKVALRTEGLTSEDVALQILREVRPDIYGKQPRAQLEALARGDAARELQAELDRAREQLEDLQSELEEFQCPHCGSTVVNRIVAPADPREKHWDLRNEFECGYQEFGGVIEAMCPSDPRFPSFDDYDLDFHDEEGGPGTTWYCHPTPRTEWAKLVHLSARWGDTQAEAEQRVRDDYLQRSARDA